MEESRLLYRSPNHAVEEVEFRAHKVVLAANLKYFDMILSNDSFQESKRDVILMQCVKVADFELFVSYAYTSEILLTHDNALNLLMAADYLGEVGIKDACIEFLKKHLKVEEACRAYKFADTIKCISLKNIAKKTILSNFRHCSQTTDYLDFNYEQLTDILSDAKGQPDESQRKFFEGIVKWIMEDANARKFCLDDLFNSVNLAKITADFMISYLYENMTDYNDEFGLMRDRIIFCYRTVRSQQTESLALAVIGFRDGKIAFQSCNFTEKKWSALEMASSDTYSLGMLRGVVLNKQFYYITKKFKQVSLNVFDPVTKQSTRLHSTSSILRYSGMCTCNEFLYFCGGLKQDDTRSQQIQKYDPLTNSFETLTPMNTERSKAAAIFYQDYLLVLGGWNGMSCPNDLNLVERYEFHTKEWTTFPSMCEERYSHAVVVLDGKLYACGGDYKNSVEVYDPSKNSWQLIASMNKKRICFIGVPYMKKLLAIGGDGENTIEVYGPLEDIWQIDYELSSGLQMRFPQDGLIPSSCIANVN